jgi:hypothetical protein
VLDPVITVSGTGHIPGGSVRIEVKNKNGLSHYTSQAPLKEKWEVNGVRLEQGPNMITAIIGGRRGAVLVTLAANIVAGKKQDPQKVWFDWHPQVNLTMKQIAKLTLNNLTRAELDSFPVAVRTQVPSLFLRTYQAFGVELVDKDGPDVHTILMLPWNVDCILGETKYDCGNRIRRQCSNVYVGTYVNDISNALINDQFEQDWGPMSLQDSAITRIRDLAEILARTAAHEFGHGLGLVGQPGYSACCAWMMGCEKCHNCEAFHRQVKQEIPEFERFGGGRFIMDPGAKTPNWARMGERTEHFRCSSREPSLLTSFDRCYLSIIIPN